MCMCLSVITGTHDECWRLWPIVINRKLYSRYYSSFCHLVLSMYLECNAAQKCNSHRSKNAKSKNKRGTEISFGYCVYIFLKIRWKKYSTITQHIKKAIEETEEFRNMILLNIILLKFFESISTVSRIIFFVAWWLSILMNEITFIYQHNELANKKTFFCSAWSCSRY